MTKIQHLLLIIIVLVFVTPAIAQVSGKGEVVKEQRQVGQFDGIDISGGQEVILMNADDYSVVIETLSNIIR